jgi:arsenate reductase (thioredoxin)
VATKPSVLFLCTGNCCRSQMAEGLMRQMADGRLEVMSAGSDPAGYVHPLAIAVMAEAGIDISGFESKGLNELQPRGFDYVVTVCDFARQACPTLSGRKGTYHWPIEDPAMVPDEAEALEAGRQVREDLKRRILELLSEWGIPVRAAGAEE